MTPSLKEWGVFVWGSPPIALSVDLSPFLILRGFYTKGGLLLWRKWIFSHVIIFWMEKKLRVGPLFDFFVFVILRNVQRIMFIGNFLQCCKLFWISTDFVSKINGFFIALRIWRGVLRNDFKKLIVYQSNHIRNQLSVNELVKIHLKK